MAEEAAALAQDYISGLDNLPAEVAHLLGEIRTKEERCQELTIRLSNRTSSILKHVRNSLPAWTPYPKEAITLPKISTEFDKLTAMQAEKVLLAERLVCLMTKHVKKLELEVLGKVADLGGVPVPPLPVIPGVNGAAGPTTSIVLTNGRASSSSGASGSGGLGGAGGAGQRVVDSFGMDGQNKKRRLNALHPPTASSPLTTSVPAAFFYPAQSSASSSSNLQQQYLPPPQIPAAYLPPPPPQQPRLQQPQQYQAPVGRPPKRARTPEPVVEVVEEEENGDEDNTPYCFCRQKSSGEMVGCDNQHCKIEWFHVACVDVPTPLPDTWFCPVCVKAGMGRKKGRK